jgi:hypothetical protein
MHKKLRPDLQPCLKKQLDRLQADGLEQVVVSPDLHFAWLTREPLVTSFLQEKSIVRILVGLCTGVGWFQATRCSLLVGGPQHTYVNLQFAPMCSEKPAVCLSLDEHSTYW